MCNARAAQMCNAGSACGHELPELLAHTRTSSDDPKGGAAATESRVPCAGKCTHLCRVDEPLLAWTSRTLVARRRAACRRCGGLISTLDLDLHRLCAARAADAVTQRVLRSLL